MGKSPEDEKIIARFRTLLSAQEKILKSYLDFTEKEKGVIISGDTVKLFRYRELENEFIKQSEAYGKVIPSFYTLYAESIREKDPAIEQLMASISRLKTKLLLLNKENRETLVVKMKSVKKELENILNRKRQKPSPYKIIGNPAYIDTSA